MELQFYHLLTTSLNHALPKLLEKALGGDYRVHVKCADAAVVKSLDDQLWSYDPDSFLPHGSAAAQADQQPIFLSDDSVVKNEANLLVITDGTALAESVEGIERVLDIFDGNDESAVMAARQRWKAYKEAGHSLRYIKQQPSGGWKQEAAA